MKKNDKMTESFAKKDGDVLTDVKELQSKSQAKPKKIKLCKSVSVLFKEKMLEKLKNAKNIDNINLPDLRKMADEVCKEIRDEKEKNKAYNTKVDETKLMTNYNLVETFIWYLFINNKFRDGLQYLTKDKKRIKKSDENTEKFEKPIIEYLRPHFKTFLTLPGVQQIQKPKIIDNVFTNFCIDMVREDNVYRKLYYINPNYVPEKKLEDIKKNINNIKKSYAVTMKLKKAGISRKGLRIQHTNEVIKALESGDKNTLEVLLKNQYKDKYNKDNEESKEAIFNPNISKQTNNAGQIHTNSNNNNLRNNDIEIRIEEQKINIENNADKEFNIKEYSDLKIKNQLNKKRKPTQNIEGQQNNKKFKYTDNNKTQSQELKKPNVWHKQQIHNTQQNFNPQFCNWNSLWSNLNQQWSNLNQRWSNLNFIQQQVNQQINNTQQNFNPQFGNLNFIQQLAIQQIANNNLLINLLNSSFNKFSKNK